ncbi:hypothetical protein ACLOJK_041016 [Asimina triloba]
MEPTNDIEILSIPKYVHRRSTNLVLYHPHQGRQPWRQPTTIRRTSDRTIKTAQKHDDDERNLNPPTAIVTDSLFAVRAKATTIFSIFQRQQEHRSAMASSSPSLSSSGEADPAPDLYERSLTARIQIAEPISLPPIQRPIKRKHQPPSAKQVDQQLRQAIRLHLLRQRPWRQHPSITVSPSSSHHPTPQSGQHLIHLNQPRQLLVATAAWIGHNHRQRPTSSTDHWAVEQWPTKRQPNIQQCEQPQLHSPSPAKSGNRKNSIPRNSNL